jgi:hypothetical protein
VDEKPTIQGSNEAPVMWRPTAAK